VTAKAAGSHPATPIEHILDRSGLIQADSDALLEHSAAGDSMWMSEKGRSDNWIEFDLASTYKLGHIQVYNFNEKWQTNRGAKKADVSVWTESTGWKKIHDDFAFTEAEGGDDYDEPVLLALGGIAARKVKFDDLVSFGDPDHVGLSEVQFFEALGPRAVRPRPVDGGDFSASAGSKLRWHSGAGVAAFNVFFGSDPEKLQLLGKVREPAIGDLPAVKRRQEYYWRVDSVTADGSLVTGKVWSFSSGQMVAWWKFDETAGTTAADSSGKGCHATAVHGDPKWNPDGRFDGCVNFDETYGFTIPKGIFQGISTSLTVSVWVKGDENQPGHSNVILQGGAGDDGKPYLVTIQTDWQDGGELRFRTGPENRDKVTYSAALQEWAGQWNHYVLVKDAAAGFQRIYLNGKLAAEEDGATAEMAGVQAARIGIAPDRFGDQYIGKLDDLRIYSYALGEDEIVALSAGGGFEDKLAAVISGRDEAGGRRNWIPVLIIFLLAVFAVTLAGRIKRQQTN
jgi:hypothetical protein